MAARHSGTSETPLNDVVELDEAVLREWDALDRLFSELRSLDSEPTDVPATPFSLPDSRGDPLFQRWIVAVRGLTRLTDVTRLRIALGEQPWTVAALVVGVGPDETRLRLTTTMRTTPGAVGDAVRDILARDCGSGTTASVTPDE